MENNNQKALQITVEDQQSLVHLGSLDSFDITAGGKKAAGLMLKYLKNPKASYLNKAIQIYEELIPSENFGGEYTALEWICRFWLSTEEAQAQQLSVPLLYSFWHELTDNDYDNLRTYLEYKYHYKEYIKGEDNTAMKARMRYLEDFILFDNPARERWEDTRRNLEKVGLKEGMRVADVGSGPGYFTFKFSDIVGESGRVYASETNPRHLAFLRKYVEANDIRNVEVVESSFNGIGLPEDVRVDVVYMCSLYHNVYAAFTDAEREVFVESIRRALGENGKHLVIVDNDLVTGENLPYHGPYINKQLIIGQLWYYGFELEDSFQFTPQRYVLVFRMTDVPKSAPVLPEPTGDSMITIGSPKSLVRYRIIGTSTSGYTRRGKLAGRLLYEGFQEGDEEKLRQAYEGFDRLWPRERIGDDYTAFLWLIRYRLSDEAGRAAMTGDPFTGEWAKFWCGNDYENFRTYLYYKFDLPQPDDPNASDDVNYEYSGTEFSIARLNKWNEYLIFNNPNRVLWEHTDSMLRFCNVQPGERIADIGCGGGYFSWQFSRMVGETGCVYATEINEGALSYLKEFVEKHQISNIHPLITKMNETGLEENSVDTIYMCSAYHAVYITDIEFVKDAFIASIHRALKKGGRLIIVDNAVTEAGVPSYYGPGILPELIIAQLVHYGFHLTDRWQETPQRFALIFREDEDYTAPQIAEPEQNRKKETDKGHGAEHLLQTLRERGRGTALGRKGCHEEPEDDHRNDY
ncbi:MAG: methyltransferase domain-containing protein [Oscillospiraceae bacterium]|nr:methyltransferase domain-containing protein [Oscillospiraceae bacterium]